MRRVFVSFVWSHQVGLLVRSILTYLCIRNRKASISQSMCVCVSGGRDKTMQNWWVMGKLKLCVCLFAVANIQKLTTAKPQLTPLKTCWSLVLSFRCHLYQLVWTMTVWVQYDIRFQRRQITFKSFGLNKRSTVLFKDTKKISELYLVSS